ncbi:MAG TPA: septum formation initiator family protein [Novosphingobium sp.]|nr:septum formation initiator family protein [Novosphingobium sp.]
MPKAVVQSKPVLAREGVAQGLALCSLLVMLALAVAGPSGLLAWGENRRLLSERKGEIEQLVKERDELRNRVALLDPKHSDPDLTSELVRKNLNVAHPDEMIMMVR